MKVSNWLNTVYGRSALAGFAAAVAVPNFSSAADRPKELEEVVVTSTKKTEMISQTPAAVSAISSEQLGEGGIKNLSDLQQAVPNLSVGDQFGVNRTFMRGIGLTSIDLGAEGAVAIHQDGAIIARPAAQLSGFYDLAQVEVLRGPQGTLYGRGATAGAINLVTRAPSNKFEADGSFTAGDYRLASFEGGIGGPIIDDKLAFRLAAKIDQHDGYGKNLFTRNPVDNRKARAVRGTARLTVSDDLEVLLSAEYFHENDNNYAFHYFGPTVGTDAALPGHFLGGKTIFDYYAAQGKKADLRNIYSDQDALNYRIGKSLTGTVDWTVKDWSLKSISSYHHFKRFNRDDLDATDVDLFGQNNYDEVSRTFSQEFNLSYEADNYDLLAGLMYFHENLFGSVRVPLTNIGLLLGQPVPPGFYLQEGSVRTDAVGFFLQGTYELTPEWEVTAGARYNYEKREGAGEFRFDAFGVRIPTDKDKSWNAITPRVVVKYHPSEDWTVYGSVTRGFKSGVINVGSRDAPVDPEFVLAYEVGIKGTGFFDNRLSGSLTAFHYKYSDLQVGFVDASSVVSTINAASATNNGVEFELRAQVADPLSVDFFATWLDATYDKFSNGYYRQGFATVNLSGNRLSNAPEYSARGGVNYDIEMGSVGKVTLRGEVNWQDKVYFTEFNNDDAKQDAYAIVNASAKYQMPDRNWAVTVWGRNLTDREVIANNIIAAPLFSSVRVGSLMPPRTYGITLDAHY